MSTKIFLVPPHLGCNQIKEKIVCIRGHRERIFNITTQYAHDKLIMHNYGQGGAGYTFLFGCVSQTLERFQKELRQNSFLKEKPIAVIGAGCYGLLTAIMLARQGNDVHLYATEFENLASHKAAGFFFPRARKSSTESEKKIFSTCSINSYKTYYAIAHGHHPWLSAGARSVSAYYDPQIDPGFNELITAKLMREPREVLIDFNNGKQHVAHEYETIHIDASSLMQELWRHIKQLAIPYTQLYIENFEQLSQPIIFNCSGLGAKKLTEDPRLIPVQGHLITLQNQPYPEKLHYMINMYCQQKTVRNYERNELLYFAPKNEGILGITFLRNQNENQLNEHEFDRLLERAHAFFGT